MRPAGGWGYRGGEGQQLSPVRGERLFPSRVGVEGREGPGGKEAEMSVSGRWGSLKGYRGFLLRVPGRLKAVLWLWGGRSCYSLAEFLQRLEESGGCEVTLPAEAS